MILYVQATSVDKSFLWSSYRRKIIKDAQSSVSNRQKQEKVLKVRNPDYRWKEQSSVRANEKDF